MLELFQENKVTVEKKILNSWRKFILFLAFFYLIVKIYRVFFCNHLVFIIHNSIAFDIC
jgi:hypothetical protein